MKLIKKVSITIFIVFISLILTNIDTSLGFTINLPKGDDTYWDRPFPGASINNVFCTEHNMRLPHSTNDNCGLNHSSDGLWHFDQFVRGGDLTPGYAKALSNAEEDSETPGYSFSVTTSTDTWQGLIWEGINNSNYQYDNPNNPYIRFDNDNVSKKVISIDRDNYVVKFSIEFGRGGTGAKISEIKLEPDNDNEVNISNVYSDKNCTNSKDISEIVSGNIYYIKVSKSEIKSSKTMKIYAKYKVKKTFDGTYAEYKCRKWNSELATFSNCESKT